MVKTPAIRSGAVRNEQFPPVWFLAPALEHVPKKLLDFFDENML
jgi:hypothetical protein